MDPNDIEMTTDGLLVRQLIQQRDVDKTRQMLSNSNGSMNNLNMSQFTDPSANYDDAQFGSPLPAPPAYPGDSIRQTSQPQVLESLLLQNGGYGEVGQMQGGMRMYNNQNAMYGQEPLLMQQTQSPSSSQLSINTQGMTAQQQQQQPPPQLTSPARSPHQVSPNYSGNRANYNAQTQHSPQLNMKQLSPQQQQQLLNRQQQQQQQQQQQSQNQSGNQSILQRCLESPGDSLLRAALTQKVPQYPNSVNTSMPQQQQQYNSVNYPASQPQQLTSLRPVPRQQISANGINNNIITAQQGNRNVMPSVQMVSQMQSSGQLMPGGQMNSQIVTHPSSSSNSLNELEADILGGLDCDMEKVLQHELSLEGTLDFNFDPTTSTSGAPEAQNMVR